MPKSRLTRRGLIVGAAPLIAAGPLAKLALDGQAEAADRSLQSHVHDHAAMGHAAMIGDGVPAVGGPHDLDSLDVVTGRGGYLKKHPPHGSGPLDPA